jgi:hypothetical protein
MFVFHSADETLSEVTRRPLHFPRPQPRLRVPYRFNRRREPRLEKNRFPLSNSSFGWFRDLICPTSPVNKLPEDFHPVAAASVDVSIQHKLLLI